MTTRLNYGCGNRKIGRKYREIFWVVPLTIGKKYSKQASIVTTTLRPHGNFSSLMGKNPPSEELL